MIDGKEGRAKEGKYKGGGFVPIGYEYDPDTEELTINDYEAVQVREIFDLFNKRTPIFTIMTQMNNKGYRHKYGTWKEITIRGMVSRRIYLGEIEHKGNVYEGQHEAIISKEVFDAAQKIVEERSKENEQRRMLGKTYKSPLGGLLYCGNCGTRYHFRSGANRKDGTRRNYYTCYSRSKGDKNYIKDPTCKNKNYRDTELDEIVFKEILRLKSEPYYFEEIKNSVDESHKIKLINDRLKELESQTSRLMDLYAIGGINIDSISSKLKPLQDEQAKLEVELSEIEVPEEKMSKEDILAMVEMLEVAIKKKNTQRIHDIVISIVDKIVIYGEEVRIHWNF